MTNEMTFGKTEVTGEIIKNSGLDRPIRAKSMVVTIFGDIIESYGGKIWLGNLISLVNLFGISERLLRTSVFRLANEGWLKKTRRGRRSFYEMTTEGKEQTELATKLIYSFKQKSWNGIWGFVIYTAKESHKDKNIQLRHHLSLMGFGALSKNIYVHPDMDNLLVKNIINKLGLHGQVLIMQSQHVGTDKESNNKEIVKQCCSFEDMDLMYRCFLQCYTPIFKKLKKKSND